MHWMLYTRTDVESGPDTVVKTALHSIRLNTSFRKHDHDLASELRVTLARVLSLVKVVREPIEAIDVSAGARAVSRQRTRKSGQCQQRC